MASWTVSSAKSRWAGPNSRAKNATIRPASRRNRCSSRMSGCDPSPTAGLGAVDVPHFHRAAVIELRMLEGQIYRFVVTGRFDGIVTAQHFFGFAVGAVGGARLTALRLADHLAGIVTESLGIFREWLFHPGHVSFGGLLHFFGAERIPGLRIAVKQEH